MDPNQIEQLRATLNAYDAAQQGTAGGWAQPRPQAAGGVLGVNVPIKVQTPDGGSIRVYLVLPAEEAASNVDVPVTRIADGRTARGRGGRA